MILGEVSRMADTAVTLDDLLRRVGVRHPDALALADPPMPTPRRTAEPLTANVTLATLKAGDTLDTLMMRVVGSRMVAAE
ncbi:MAG TPA: hypothetical protein VFJ59_02135 [Pseudolabrys sp.]|nr:hypothetical protein [Pseudolabrys sp.]